MPRAANIVGFALAGALAAGPCSGRDLHDLYFGKPDPATLLPLEGELAGEVTRRVEALGFATLDDWAGWANYEERLVPGRIDPIVLEKLRAEEPTA